MYHFRIYTGPWYFGFSRLPKQFNVFIGPFWFQLEKSQ